MLEDYDQDYITTHLDIVSKNSKKKTIDSLGAYTLKAFKEDWRPVETEQEQQIKEEKEQKRKDAILAKQEKALLRQYHQQLKQACEDILTTHDSKAIATAFKHQTYAHIVKTIDEHKISPNQYMDKKYIKPLYMRFIAEKHLTEERHSFENRMATQT